MVPRGGGPVVVAARGLTQDTGAGGRSPQVQGPRGPGSLKGECCQEPPFPESEEMPRRGDGREKTVASAADAEPSVDVLVRAEPVVHYTIKSTVNAHSCFVASTLCLKNAS